MTDRTPLNHAAVERLSACDGLLRPLRRAAATRQRDMRRLSNGRTRSSEGSIVNGMRTAQGTWVCGYVLTFEDGGEPEEQVLHIGTREDCERTADLLPAVSYSGRRPGPQARMVVMPYPKDDPGV